MKKSILALLVIVSIMACNSEKKEEVKKQENQKEKKAEKPVFDAKPFKMKGKEIAMGTFKVFKAKIEGIGQAEGLPNVVGFCNKNAQKLMDSIGKANNVSMMRTSHKLRNEKHAPNADQKAIIENYQRAQEKHKEMEPIVMKDADGFVHFYAPIKLKEKCLACHGKPEVQIKEPVMKAIVSKYPKDRATGFVKGELRGIWDIKFLDK